MDKFPFITEPNDYKNGPEQPALGVYGEVVNIQAGVGSPGECLVAGPLPTGTGIVWRAKAEALGVRSTSVETSYWHMERGIYKRVRETELLNRHIWTYSFLSGYDIFLSLNRIGDMWLASR